MVVAAPAATAAAIQACDGKKEYAEKSHSHCREACDCGDCELPLSLARL
jgi:hypothetical protein